LSHAILGDGRFHRLLLRIDQDLAAKVRAGRCTVCGGPLHSANYVRKPRGGPTGLGEEHSLRFDLCCGREGCRKRHLPMSVRFLARKVYLGVVVVLVSALQHGVTPKRAAKLQEAVGASARTVERWCTWWLTDFRESHFWKAMHGRFRTPLDEATLPRSLVDGFGGEGREPMERLMRFLSPITTASAPGCMPI
jgi:hypothetical protein